MTTDTREISALEFLRLMQQSGHPELKMTMPAPLADYIAIAGSLGWTPDSEVENGQ